MKADTPPAKSAAPVFRRIGFSRFGVRRTGTRANYSAGRPAASTGARPPGGVNNLPAARGCPDQTLVARFSRPPLLSRGEILPPLRVHMCRDNRTPLEPLPADVGGKDAEPLEHPQLAER